MDFEQMNNNKVYIAGTVLTEPKFSYDVFGEGFYEFMLEVKRLSDATDESRNTTPTIIAVYANAAAE